MKHKAKESEKGEWEILWLNEAGTWSLMSEVWTTGPVSTLRAGIF